MYRSILSKSVFVFLSLCVTSPSYAEGAFDFLDYCKKAERDFKSNSEALSAAATNTQAKYLGWYNDPHTIPPTALSYYRSVVRAAAYKGWSDSTTGSALIELWKEKDPSVDVEDKFVKEIYNKEISSDKEAILARRFYKVDYEANIKKRIDEQVNTLNANIAENKKELDANCS